jgi:hypothetical protein
MEVIPEGINITEESCNNDFWRAQNGKIGDEAEIIIDLKCPMRLETFSIMNGFGSFGTKEFSIFGSREKTGPWTELFRGELQQGIEMTEEVRFITLPEVVV